MLIEKLPVSKNQGVLTKAAIQEFEERLQEVYGELAKLCPMDVYTTENDRKVFAAQAPLQVKLVNEVLEPLVYWCKHSRGAKQMSERTKKIPTVIGNVDVMQINNSERAGHEVRTLLCAVGGQYGVRTNGRGISAEKIFAELTKLIDEQSNPKERKTLESLIELAKEKPDAKVVLYHPKRQTRVSYIGKNGRINEPVMNGYVFCNPDMPVRMIWPFVHRVKQKTEHENIPGLECVRWLTPEEEI